MKLHVKNLSTAVFCLGLASICNAQAPAAQTPDSTKPADQTAAPPAAAPAAPTALPTPAITGPLSGLPPAVFEAGPFGRGQRRPGGAAAGGGRRPAQQIRHDHDGRGEL